ncbi:MAG: retron system putative HNH endonuclease [Halieaceae bacterium]|jgi:uncharacterized protein (TIGR02646 family)|nr:retron system putative HNH endonuclease [Halieaceae bacterium]
MMEIAKNSEPNSLTEHRAAAYSDYDNYAEKDELRVSLVGEQQGICCYCMGRIRADTNHMKIEHWQCQDRFPERQLDYGNLLGACNGGEGKPGKMQHCDTRKGNADLKWSPADPMHAIAERVAYLTDGTIDSADGEFREQLNEVLNLNLPVLKNNRKGVIDGLMEWWKREKARLKGPVPKTTLERELAARLEGGELAPYTGVAVWWLSVRLTRLS